jgi:hypothetical protein
LEAAKQSFESLILHRILSVSRIPQKPEGTTMKNR